MATFNRITLVGNMVQDPEVRYTPQGAMVVQCRIATNHRMKVGQEWKEEACFLDITLFGTLAEEVAGMVTKGDCAYVEGRLRQRTWKTQAGESRSKYEVIADRMFLVMKPSASTSGALQAPSGDAVLVEQVGQQVGTYVPPGVAPRGYVSSGTSEDIPF